MFQSCCMRRICLQPLWRDLEARKKNREREKECCSLMWTVWMYFFSPLTSPVFSRRSLRQYWGKWGVFWEKGVLYTQHKSPPSNFPTLACRQTIVAMSRSSRREMVLTPCWESWSSALLFMTKWLLLIHDSEWHCICRRCALGPVLSYISI